MTQTLEYLDTIERTKQEANQLKQQLAQAPAKLRQATEGLEALKSSSADTMTKESLANYSLRQLESRLNETLDNLQSAQEDLSAYNSQLIALQTQPERVQSAMYSASMRLMQIRNQLNGLTPNQESLRPTQQQELLAEQVMLNGQLDLERKIWRQIPPYKICCKNNGITRLHTLINWSVMFSCYRRLSAVKG